MEKEKLKLLRERISIPLKEAIKLLQKNNGDVLVCENEFHNKNIQEISQITECDEELARKEYKICKHDVKKTIKRINNRGIVITTRVDRVGINKIGFILWPENAEGEEYKTVKRNDVFIPTDDFDYIIDVFKSVFPQKDPIFENIEDGFDPCGTNYFDKNTCKLILEKMDRILPEKSEIENFIKEVKEWFEDKLTYADIIVVFGNL